MDELIRKAARLLRTLYISFWLVPVVVVFLGETTEGWVGYYAGDVRTTYFVEALCILLAAICVPVSLKLFAWVLKRRIDVAAMGRALQMYVFWSGMRMVLLDSRLPYLLCNVEYDRTVVWTHSLDGIVVLPAG